jgi:hypothetical protein
MAWTEIVAEVQSIYCEAVQSVRSRGLQT